MQQTNCAGEFQRLLTTFAKNYVLLSDMRCSMSTSVQNLKHEEQKHKNMRLVLGENSPERKIEITKSMYTSLTTKVRLYDVRQQKVIIDIVVFIQYLMVQFFILKCKQIYSFRLFFILIFLKKTSLNIILFNILLFIHS